MMNSNEVKLELEGSAKRKATDIYDSCIYLSSHGGHATRANSIRTMSQSEWVKLNDSGSEKVLVSASKKRRVGEQDVNNNSIRDTSSSNIVKRKAVVEPDDSTPVKKRNTAMGKQMLAPRTTPTRVNVEPSYPTSSRRNTAFYIPKRSSCMSSNISTDKSSQFKERNLSGEPDQAISTLANLATIHNNNKKTNSGHANNVRTSNTNGDVNTNESMGAGANRSNSRVNAGASSCHDNINNNSLLSNSTVVTTNTDVDTSQSNTSKLESFYDSQRGLIVKMIGNDQIQVNCVKESTFIFSGNYGIDVSPVKIFGKVCVNSVTMYKSEDQEVNIQTVVTPLSSLFSCSLLPIDTENVRNVTMKFNQPVIIRIEKRPNANTNQVTLEDQL